MRTPTSPGGRLPFWDKSDEEFEDIVFLLKKKEFDGTATSVERMQGVGERGRDILVYNEGKVTQVIQCKNLRKRLPAPELRKEMLKLAIHYYLDPQILSGERVGYELWCPGGLTEQAMDFIVTWPEGWSDDQLISDAERVIKSYKRFDGLRWSNIADKVISNFRKKVTPSYHEGIIISQLVMNNKYVFETYFEFKVVLDKKQTEEAISKYFNQKTDEPYNAHPTSPSMGDRVAGHEMKARLDFNKVLEDYEETLERFIDPETGAIFENGRDDGTPKFLFTEVTGYCISDLVFLYQLTLKQTYLHKAIKAAEWIITCAMDECGGVKTRYYFDKDDSSELIEKSFQGRRIYSLDTAVCLKGMLDLYDVTKEEKYLQVSIRMGKFLLVKMVDVSGTVSAIYRADSDECLPDNKSIWSKQFGAFHSKVAESLYALYQHTDEVKFKERSISICNKVVEFARPSGNFTTSANVTELHPHCYAAEGLLFVGYKEKNRSYINTAKYAVEWALSKVVVGEIGQSFDIVSEKPLTKFRIDALAQLLLLSVTLKHQKSLDSDLHHKIEKIVAKILSMKEGSKYFRYGFYESGLEAKTLSYWTNMFCLHALYKYHLFNQLERTWVIILAGGKGTRCWPVACETLPKPLSVTLLYDRTLLEETVDRFLREDLFQPDHVYVFGSSYTKKAVENDNDLCGLPPSNLLVEVEPEGTLPAIRNVVNKLSHVIKNDDLIVVSMSDDVILPRSDFQRTIVRGVHLAETEDCFVSIGKAATSHDCRFGHMSYKNQVGYCGCFEVEKFKEKPDSQTYQALEATSSHMAWECGTVVFSKKYYDTISSVFDGGGNFAEKILSKVTGWRPPVPNPIRMAVAILPHAVKFEDFGTLGPNLHRFFVGDKRHDVGNGNICLGKPANVQLLNCKHNLVISDKLTMKLYGLDNYLIVDNSWTNTAVIMPLSDYDKLPNLYNVLCGSEYEPFTIGGVVANKAKPASFTSNCGEFVKTETKNGLIFLYEVNKVSIERDENFLRVCNLDLPYLSPNDFDAFFQKQCDDDKIVEHLIHVAALAESFCGDDAILLSKKEKEILRLLCLYHDFGGFLNSGKEDEEAEIIRDFSEISNLDRTLLDSTVVLEMFKQFSDRSVISGDEELVAMFNDSTNSAVQFIRSQTAIDKASRDVVIFLLQIQNNPELLASLYKESKSRFNLTKEQIEKIFACLKIAEITSNGKWLWKRNKYRAKSSKYQGFLNFNNGVVEDYPFILTLILSDLKKLNIDCEAYVERFNNLLLNESSIFYRVLTGITEDSFKLVADEFYIEILNGCLGKEKIKEDFPLKAKEVMRNKEQQFQLLQMIHLSRHLRSLQPSCIRITDDIIDAFVDATLDFHKQYRMEVESHLARELYEVYSEGIHLTLTPLNGKGGGVSR